MSRMNLMNEAGQRKIYLILFFGTVFNSCNYNSALMDDPNSWEAYRGNENSNAYSELSIIDKNNIDKLDIAWVFRTGDSSGSRSTIQCNPLVIDNIIYLTSATLKVFALNAVTGEKLWEYDPFPDSDRGGTNRGLAFWAGQGKKRLFYCARNDLVSIDAVTGKPAWEFGLYGKVDLRNGLGRDEGDSKRNITNSSPGVVFNNLLIIGSSVGEEYGSMPGHIRAFDVESGEQKWIFHTIPQPGEPGYNTWPKEYYLAGGGANAWGGLSLDKERGIVFAPLGSPTHDFYGGDRAGVGLYGNSLLALDAVTGAYKWHFQTTHHDLWDYDLPTPPNLVTVKHNGKEIDAVAQITKSGFVFLFDRENGEPLFEIKEMPVPASTVPGEQAWPTQPFPVAPPPLVRQYFDETQITNISPEAYNYVVNQLEGYAMGPMYLPPSESGTVQIPGFRGGGEWSGGAFDPETGIIYVGVNDIPNLVQVIEDEPLSVEASEFDDITSLGEKVYVEKCAACHGIDRKGNVTFPSLLSVKDRIGVKEAKEMLGSGKGMMPSFQDMSEISQQAVLAYLYGLNQEEAGKLIPLKEATDRNTTNADSAMRFKLKAYTQLRDQEGYPGIKPPWGSLCALDLNKGEIKWKVPLGEYAALTARGIPPTGTQLFGGGIVTKGGLIFIGASRDEKFRALDKESGKVLWEYQLPAGGYATPATYAVNEEQYVIIAAGGGGMQGTKTGDYFLAFKLKGN